MWNQALEAQNYSLYPASWLALAGGILGLMGLIMTCRGALWVIEDGRTTLNSYPHVVGKHKNLFLGFFYEMYIKPT